MPHSTFVKTSGRELNSAATWTSQLVSGHCQNFIITVILTLGLGWLQKVVAEFGTHALKNIQKFKEGVYKKGAG